MRRRLLLFGGLAALAGCDSGTGDADAPAVLGAEYDDAVLPLVLAAAVENLTVSMYSAVMDSTAGRELPATTRAVLERSRQQHVRHAEVWNEHLTAAGKPALTTAPLAGAAELLRRVDGGETLRSLLDREEVVAQTYTALLGRLDTAAWAATAAQVQPVEHMHAAVLSTLLGVDPAGPAVPPLDRALGVDAVVR